MKTRHSRLAALALAGVLAVAPRPAAAQQEAFAEPAPPVQVTEMAICKDVVDRAPVGAADSFPSDVGQLWCFTRVVTDRAPLRVFHRWWVGDRLVNEIPIPVKSAHWRCWSRKTILPSWSGPCRVEVATEEGDVVLVREFRLEAAAPEMPEAPPAPDGD